MPTPNEIDQRLADARNKRRIGLGDAVAAVLKAVGVEACESCKKRKEALNRLGNRFTN